MKIIGHRGAAGLAPENTLASIRAAIKAGVDAIEFDVRKTLDGKLVLCHDKSLLRTHGADMTIADTSYDELISVSSSEIEAIPSLQDALQLIGDRSVLIEGKGEGWATALAIELNDHANKKNMTVISFHHQELFIFGQKCPNIRLYACNQYNAMDALNAARLFGFDGIDVNYWVINPLVYWLCRRHKLDVTVYTLDTPWIAQLFKWLYPNLAITTNVPQKMQFLPPKQKRTSKK